MNKELTLATQFNPGEHINLQLSSIDIQSKQTVVLRFAFQHCLEIVGKFSVKKDFPK